jgi:hypothetical protein
MAVNSYQEIAAHVGHELECVEYSGGANVAIECRDCNIVLLDFDKPPAPTAADLSEWRGSFAEGWTEEDIDRVLNGVTDALNVQFLCVWEYVDEYGPGGHSTLISLIDDRAHALPRGLWDLLVEGFGGGRIDPATIPDLPDPDVDLAQLCDYRSERGFNRAFEDRRQELVE